MPVVSGVVDFVGDGVCGGGAGSGAGCVGGDVSCVGGGCGGNGGGCVGGGKYHDHHSPPMLHTIIKTTVGI